MFAGGDVGPGSAAHYAASHSASKTRVNALTALRSIRGTELGDYPPRTGGISTWSRRQARRSISSQARNCRSLLRQTRTSLSRRLSQVTEIAELLKPGLALMKASSRSPGAIVFGSDNCRYSSGIFTAERALRMVSK